jgi:hypothetical protein
VRRGRRALAAAVRPCRRAQRPLAAERGPSEWGSGYVLVDGVVPVGGGGIGEVRPSVDSYSPRGRHRRLGRSMHGGCGLEARAIGVENWQM